MTNLLIRSSAEMLTNVRPQAWELQCNKGYQAVIWILRREVDIRKVGLPYGKPTLGARVGAHRGRDSDAYLRIIPMPTRVVQ